jgi:poly(A) polymerase
VRDHLLGEQGPDIDVVVVGGNALELAEALAKAAGADPPKLFERFGTALVALPGLTVHLADARRESYPDRRSRKPEVAPASLIDDVLRRDFTVNTLLMDLEGNVLDPTGRGLADLEARVLRTPRPAAQTLDEDPLRALRAVRFAARLGFRLAPGLARALPEAAPRLGEAVSRERVGEEVGRMFDGPQAAEALRLLSRHRLLDVFWPEAAAMRGVIQGGYHRWDVFEHSRRAVAALPEGAGRRLRLATFLHDAGKPKTRAERPDGPPTFYGHAEVGAAMAYDMITRLRMPSDLAEQVRALVALHMRPIAYEPGWSDAAVRRLARDAGPLWPDLMALARADTAASAYKDVKGKLDHLAERVKKIDLAKLARLGSPLDGDELVSLAGRPPGPWVGRVKKLLLEKVLEGELAERGAEAARAWLRAHPEVLRD